MLARETQHTIDDRYVCGCLRNVVEHHDDDCPEDCSSEACVQYDLSCSTHDA
jgi:hypothetical protein